MNEPVKVGMVGFGISGKVFHAPFLTTSKNYQLVSVFERTKQESKEKYPFVNVVNNLEGILNDSSIELVVITTPNETHFPYAKAALKAGKHVVLEKPFTNTSEEAKQLIEIASDAGKLLSVYQNRRYVSDFLTLKEILSKHLLGEIHSFEGHYDRYRPEPRPNAWREESKAGSGIVYDLGAHLIDQVLCLFGLPKTIAADIRMQRPHAKVDDYFDLRLDYGFTKVILEAGMLVREAGPRYMIHGTLGSLIKYGEDPQEAQLRAGALPEGENWGEEPAEWMGLLHTEMNGKLIKEKYPTLKGNYGQYYENLYKSIRNKAPLHEKPEQSYNVIRLIELAFDSHYKHCTIPCTGLLPVAY